MLLRSWSSQAQLLRTGNWWRPLRLKENLGPQRRGIPRKTRRTLPTEVRHFGEKGGKKLQMYSKGKRTQTDAGASKRTRTDVPSFSYGRHTTGTFVNVDHFFQIKAARECKANKNAKKGRRKKENTFSPAEGRKWDPREQTLGTHLRGL